MSQTANSKGNNTQKITRRNFMSRAAALSGVISAPWIIPASALGTGENVSRASV